MIRPFSSTSRVSGADSHSSPPRVPSECRIRAISASPRESSFWPESRALTARAPTLAEVRLPAQVRPAMFRWRKSLEVMVSP